MKSKRKHWGARIIIIAVLAVVSAGVLIMRKRLAKKNGSQALKTETVKRGTITATVSGNGVLEPLTTVDVKSNVGGQIVELAVDEGDFVKAGQLIARIDPTDAQSALEQQQANLESAKSRYNQSQETLSMQRVQSEAQLHSAEISLATAKTRLAQAEETLRIQPQLTQNAIDSAQANYDFAQKDLERQKGLYENGFVSKSDLDSATQKFQVAQAQLESAKVNQSQIKLRQMDVDSARAAVRDAEASLGTARANLRQIDIRKGDIVQAQAQVSSATAAVQNARTQLGYTTINSPREGVIAVKYAEEGSIVTGGRSSNSGTGAGVSIVQIADTTRMLILVNVDETDIAQIRVDQKVRISIDAYSDEKFTGEVTKIAPQAVVTQNVTTIPVTVEINNPDRKMKPGMNATCDFITGQKENVLMVPNEAVRETKGANTVMVMENGKPSPRKVETGLEGNDYTEIVSGLKEGETVVTSTIASSPTSGAGAGGAGGARGNQRGGPRPPFM